MLNLYMNTVHKKLECPQRVGIDTLNISVDLAAPRALSARQQGGCGGSSTGPSRELVIFKANVPATSRILGSSWIGGDLPSEGKHQKLILKWD